MRWIACVVLALASALSGCGRGSRVAIPVADTFRGISNSGVGLTLDNVLEASDRLDHGIALVFVDHHWRNHSVIIHGVRGSGQLVVFRGNVYEGKVDTTETMVETSDPDCLAAYLSLYRIFESSASRWPERQEHLLTSIVQTQFGPVRTLQLSGRIINPHPIPYVAVVPDEIDGIIADRLGMDMGEPVSRSDFDMVRYELNDWIEVRSRMGEVAHLVNWLYEFDAAIYAQETLLKRIEQNVPME